MAPSEPQLCNVYKIKTALLLWSNTLICSSIKLAYQRGMQDSPIFFLANPKEVHGSATDGNEGRIKFVGQSPSQIVRHFGGTGWNLIFSNPGEHETVRLGIVCKSGPELCPKLNGYALI